VTPRLLSRLLLLLALSGVLWTLLRPSTEADWFCAAAASPEAYEDAWFYTLQEGPDGWLLRHADLQSAAAPPAAALEGLMRLNRALGARGVTLLIAAQPPRGIALPEGSVEGYSPSRALRDYRAFKTALVEAGVLTADLGTVAADQPDFFFRRDHHWTPEGARASAAAVAALIRATPTYTTLEPRTYTTERVTQETQVGSYGEAVGRACGQDPPAETLTRYETRLQTPDDATSESLFAAAASPPIALAGTSNSARDDLNFAGFLAQETGLEVLNVSAVGGGPETALDAFLRSETFAASPPPFLVWEFSTLFDLPSERTFYRQLVPSVGGACSVADSVRRVRRRAAPELLLFEAPPPASFLYLEASDLSLVTFEVEASYRDGRTERLSIERPTRARNDGRFFLALEGDLERLSLKLPETAAGELEARLCP
jgi:alginate biosynthesis protein AlgX